MIYSAPNARKKLSVYLTPRYIHRIEIFGLWRGCFGPDLPVYNKKGFTFLTYICREVGTPQCESELMKIDFSRVGRRMHPRVNAQFFPRVRRGIS